MEDQRRLPQIAGVDEGQVDAFADDRLVARLGGANQVRRQSKCRFVVKLSLDALLGQFHSVALDARESNLERVAIRRDRLHLDSLAGRLRRRDDRSGVEVEGDAEYVGVLDRE